MALPEFSQNKSTNGSGQESGRPRFLRCSICSISDSLPAYSLVATNCCSNPWFDHQKSRNPAQPLHGITKGVYRRSSQTVARRLISANNPNRRKGHSHAESGYLSVAGTNFHELSEMGTVLTEFDEGEYFNTVAQWLDMFERGNHTDSSEGQGHRRQIRRTLLASDGDAEEEVGGFDGRWHFTHHKLSDETPRRIEENADRTRKSCSFAPEMRARYTGRRLMLTEGMFVMGPARSQIGDLVV